MKKFIAMLLILLAVAIPKATSQQRQPDAKRQKEIRAALVSHGYQAGKTWPETQEILRSIAKTHHWQITHAPDARVLILIGLGNEHSDLQILDLHRNHLDGK